MKWRRLFRWFCGPEWWEGFSRQGRPTNRIDGKGWREWR